MYDHCSSCSLSQRRVSTGSGTIFILREWSYSLTHCCAWPARAVATSTTSDPASMTTASRLCTRDPLPPVVSRSSLASQVDASSRGQGICPARGWRSAGGCCGLAHLVVGGKCPSNECLLSAMLRGRSVSFVWLRTESLATKSCHFMFRMRHCAFMWKACSRLNLSTWGATASPIFWNLLYLPTRCGTQQPNCSCWSK